MRDKRNDRRPAVFLDRDGTLMVDAGPLTRFRPELLYPGVVEALREVTAMGLPVLLVTNQGWVARGNITFDDAARATGELAQYLRAADIEVLGYAFCPHHPRGASGPYAGRCACRKPEPGLLLKLADRYPVDLARSLMVGDNLIDLEAGRRAGAHSAIVLTGDGRRHLGRIPDGVPVLAHLGELPALLRTLCEEDVRMP